MEYEILDEHGNQIMISGAEKLKQLAACVNEIRQKDGSIVKEYILNDPKIIEHIKSQIKTNNTVQHETIQKNITITAYQVDGITISNDNQHSKGLINDQNDKENEMTQPSRSTQRNNTQTYSNSRRTRANVIDEMNENSGSQATQSNLSQVVIKTQPRMRK